MGQLKYISVVMILVFIIILVSINRFGAREQKTLPVYQPKDFNPALVDPIKQGQGANHTITSFSLINQEGKVVTEQDYRNKIYVADFFFTRCPSICPIMANNMNKLQNEFLDDPEIKLLSLSVTPDLDSVPVLRQYADKNGVIPSKWNITTGDKKHIYDLARRSFFAAVDEGDGGLQDFIHTPNFVLVDKLKQIRGIYNGTLDDELNRLIGDIYLLKKE
ncbi:SCO family protein [Arenibacter lacus]|uniref:SCO family protein n=2 Tax=Arenibacter TaxID=178469 RepID=UPI000A3BA155|nr:SCO family protein [Arenibacter lacus]